MNKWLAWIVSAVVVAAVVAAFFVVGSPMHQRQLNFDNRRVMDLQNLQNQILNYYQTKGHVPEQVSDINDC